MESKALESKALEVTEVYSAERAIAPRVTLDSMKANIAYEAPPASDQA